jgi:hypothetical protein
MRLGQRGYGIDLGENGRLTVVRADRIGLAWRFASIRPDNTGFVREQAAGRRVAAALLCRESFTRFVEAPLRDTRKAMRVMHSVLDVQLPFPIEDCICEFLAPTRTATGATSALAVAARQRDIADRLTTLSASGFDPAILDQEGLALWAQELRESPSAAPSTLRILICLHEREAILVIGRGSRFLGCHSVRPVVPASIQRVLSSYPAPEGNVVWSFCGSLPNLSEQAQSLHEALSKERPGVVLIHKDPGAFLARALAVRAASRGALWCNMRTGAFVHPRVSRRAARTVSLAIAAVAASGIILAAAGSMTLFAARAREATLSRAVSSMADDVAGYHISARGEDAIRLAKAALSERRRVLRPFLDATAPSLVDRLADIAYYANRDRLRIEALSLSLTNLTASGIARTWTSCDALADRFKSLGYPVTLNRKDAVEDYWIPFTLVTEERHD